MNVWLFCVGLKWCVWVSFFDIVLSVLLVYVVMLLVCMVGCILLLRCMNSVLLIVLCSCVSVWFNVDGFNVSLCVVVVIDWW